MMMKTTKKMTKKKRIETMKWTQTKRKRRRRYLF